MAFIAMLDSQYARRDAARWQTTGTPDSFRFLQDLRQHNERDWFQKNKQCYERVVREPLLRFIGDLGSPLRKIDPYFVADPRPIGAQ